MPLRPTPDALRERAFAVLADRLTGRALLDLYAGTGAVGLEALSRGAARVVAVERHPAAARLARANAAALGADREGWKLLVAPARRAVRRLAAAGERFDLAWADPPFDRWREGLAVLRLAFELGVLVPGAVAALECPLAASPEALPDELRVVRELAGGASRLLLLARLP